MILTQTDGGLHLAGVRDFCLTDILTCGQCFRWNEISPGTFYGVAGGMELTIAQREDTLRLKGCTIKQYEEFWRDYFDLNRDYGSIKVTLRGDETMRRAIGFTPGMRVLRQEPWEALCSFILSQNNNLARIRGIVARLCEAFGEPLPGGGQAFPSPQAISGLTVNDLAPLRAGFRAKYVLDAARKVSSGAVSLDEVARMEYDKAQETLRQIHGVGVKVADCALLYGFHKVEAFPLDVWMKRVMERFYPGGLPDCILTYPGIAQQYLFHYIRCGCEVSA